MLVSIGVYIICSIERRMVATPINKNYFFKVLT
jgi:hypothetical protein